ncbi:MAG: 50S ribosomal protein L11 methyltransferase [Pyrinomonadaceae bacterium]|nr:50S ribosomal protein L11 methyltransferase [Pyrinomonadaceae bacterium]MBP6213703.1 50S ribosomal protein L11 methyltransferase [Pyrinomonadaceae bacterium]
MDKSKKNWFAVDILIASAATEAAEFALNELDALGTEIDSLRKPKDEPLRVSGYFEALPDEAEIKNRVEDAISIYGLESSCLVSVETRTVEQTDWLAEWKKHWRPTTIGRFVIAPPWEKIDDESKIVIRIEPNMAFGTGTHETTKLCVKAIDTMYRPQQSVLDVGTGTGILAIAAAKLGGTQILACDTDIDSVAIARENAVLNGVGGQIDYFDGSIDSDTPKFDFVCANLTIDVILPLLDNLLSSAVEILLLSGILGEQKEMITNALGKRGISDFEIDSDGEWIAVVVHVN